jgi:hypothetical protein
MYGTLLEAAAYTAAVDGNRSAASELIGEAKASATRLGGDANHRFTAFGPTNVALYQVSIAQVLGDSGTAIEHAKTVRPQPYLPLSGKAGTGSTSPALITSGTNRNLATVPSSQQNTARRTKSATGHQSTG